MKNRLAILLFLLPIVSLVRAQETDSLLRTCPVAEDLYSPRVTCTHGSTSPYTYQTVYQHSDEDSCSHLLNTDTSRRCVLTGSALRFIPEGDSLSFTIGNAAFPTMESLTMRYRVDTNSSDLLRIRYAPVINQREEDSLPGSFSLLVRDSNGNAIAPCYDRTLFASDLPNQTDNARTITRWQDWTSMDVDLTPFHGQLIDIHAVTRDGGGMEHTTAWAYLAPHCAKADSVIEYLDSCQYYAADTADCDVRFKLVRHRYKRILIEGDTLLVEVPGPNAFWHIDGTPQSIMDSFCILNTGVHRIEYFAQTTDSTFENTVSMNIAVDDFCHCYDTIRDTIVENDLPWRRLDTVFTSDIDTVIIHPDIHPRCDSIISYHLKVYWNVADTIDSHTCSDSLPVIYNGDTLYAEGSRTNFFYGDHGQDSLVTFRLHVIPDSDTTLYDTILDTQLPWYFHDSVFTDTAKDFAFHFVNEAGCDSTVYYNLYIFWSGDHCDSTLYFPNIVTPNGDGANDKFVVWGLLENDCFRYNELTIYDRTGRCVFHKVNIANDNDWWAPSDRMPAGSYFYYFRAHGVHIHTQHTGVIELLRKQ